MTTTLMMCRFANVQMCRCFAVLLCFIALNSCAESYNTRDPKEFNQKIAGRTDIETPEELIRVYYRIDEIEDTFGITIEVEEPEKDHFVITLIQEGLEDDELAALKYVLFANRSGQTWIVTEIRSSWKNWEGYGHTGWGT